MHTSINGLQSHNYRVLYVRGMYEPPSVLAQRNSHNFAYLDHIVRTYLQAAMPDGVTLTLDVNDFMSELSRNIDRIDAEREREGFVTAASMDALLAQSIQRLKELGGNVAEPRQILSREAARWLDDLVGRHEE